MNAATLGGVSSRVGALQLCTKKRVRAALFPVRLGQHRPEQQGRSARNRQGANEQSGEHQLPIRLRSQSLEFFRIHRRLGDRTALRRPYNLRSAAVYRLGPSLSRDFNRGAYKRPARPPSISPLSHFTCSHIPQRVAFVPLRPPGLSLTSFHDQSSHLSSLAIPTPSSRAFTLLPPPSSITVLSRPCL